MKKVISIIGIALIVTGLGLTSYYYFVFDKIDPATGKKETFRQFLPFGSNNAVPKPADQVTANVPDESGGFIPPTHLADLQQITKEAVAGSILLDQPYASSTVLRYMERATGNIYDFSIATGTLSRITNTTFPKIVETVWSPKGSKVIMRSLENDNDYISSYYAELQNSTSSAEIRELQGKYLPASLDFVTLLGNGDTLFSLMENADGATGYTSALDGSKRIMVFQSPIREWIPQGLNNGNVVLTTKASSHANGFMYMFNPASGTLTKIIGNITGLTTLMSPDGKYALFSENSNGVTTNLLDIQNKTVTQLSLATLPEKCAWAADSSAAFCGVSRIRLGDDFIDGWYQGLISTSDDLWIIEPVNTNIGVVASIADRNMDMTNLSVSKTKKYVTFMNKKDLSLWVYRIPQPVAPPSTATSSATASSSVR